MTIDDPKSFLNYSIDNKSIKLISILGCGSQGVVYLGQYIYTNRFYAVKCVADNHLTENEILAHSVLSGHQNILSLEKVVREKNYVFIVMEYATHRDLFSCIKESTLPKDSLSKHRTIRRLFLQILEAVQYCHRNMIAHRDLKPENILLLSNYRVKLADFGLATQKHVSTEYNHGTSFYFSPECQNMYFYNTSRNSNGYDTFSNDVWSLGVILVTLLSGKNPWKCANLKDPAFASFVANPRCFFQTVIPNISKSLNRILLDVFCLDPSKRIRLNELRSMFLRCHRFTVESVPTIKTALSPVSTKKPPVPSYELPCTKSFESTIIEYIGHYKEETEVSKAQHTASTSHRISYLSIYSNSTGSTCSLSSTSSFSGESPSTPRNGSPVLNYFIPKPKHLDLGFP